MTTPAKRKRFRVVLCAALTADGKLDASATTLPPGLDGENAGPVRHPWATLYAGAAGILVDRETAMDFWLLATAARPVLTLDWKEMEASEPAARRAELRRALVRVGIKFAGTLLCFGGAGLCRALLETGLVDEIRLMVRAKIDGRCGSASLSGVRDEFFPASIFCRLAGMEVVGDECFVHYRIARRASQKRADA